MDILDLFWGPLTLLSKVPIYICLFNPRTLSGPAQNPVIFDLIFDHFGPFLRVLRGELPARTLKRGTSCLWAGGPAQSLSNPCQGPKFWSFWPLFLLKSQFLSFCLSGVSENAILTLFWPPFWALLRPNLWPLAKMGLCLFWPTDRMDLGGTLRDPILTLILTILDPFWGSWRRSARPPTSCLWAGRTCLEPLKPMPKTSNFGHLTTFPIEKVNFVILPIRVSENAILTLFWPHLSPPEPCLASAKRSYIWPPWPWMDLGGPSKITWIFTEFCGFRVQREVAGFTS